MWSKSKRGSRFEVLESRLCLSSVGFVVHQLGDTDFLNIESSIFADLDGDGDQDIALSAENRTGWYENSGEGDFGQLHQIPTVSPRHHGGKIVAKDLDGDDDLDLIVDAGIGAVYWHKNEDGNGTYGSPVEIRAATSAWDLVLVEDLNGDGFPDLVTAERECAEDACTHVVRWQANRGDGTFEQLQSSIADQQDLNTMEFVDIDGDGNRDLVLGNSSCSPLEECSYQKMWYKNSGGQLERQARQIYQQQTVGRWHSVHRVQWEDMDSDGDIDGVITAAALGGYYWVENVDGTGEFSEPKSMRALGLAIWNPFSLGDFDGDDVLDLVTFDASLRIVWMPFMEATRSFGQARVITESMPVALDLMTADMDGDGAQDVIAVSAPGSSMAWFQNRDGGRSFSNAHPIGQSLTAARGLKPSDLDRDGDTDFLFTRFDDVDRPIEWFENRAGQGEFVRSTIPNTLQGFIIEAADLDGDGDLELITEDDRLLVWYENDAGNFVNPRRIAARFDIFEGVDLLDFDGDGDLDVVAPKASRMPEWYENVDGRGTFESRQFQFKGRVDDRTQFGPFADLDGDGDLDMAYSIRCTVCRRAVGWMVNNGGSFERIVLNPAGSRNYTASIDDIDTDGDLDLYFNTRFGGGFLYWNEGDGNFAETTHHSDMGFHSVDAYLADVDADQDLDIVEIEIDRTFRSVWYENEDGNRNFSASQPLIQFDRRPIHTSFGDWDNDGDIDVVSSTLDPVSIRWYENRPLGDSNGDGVFNSRDLVHVFRAAKYEDGIANNATFEEGDWNGDGDFDSADLIVAHATGNYQTASRPRARDIVVSLFDDFHEERFKRTKNRSEAILR